MRRTSSKELEGLIIPVVVTVYSDRTFTFVTKTPPAPVLLKRAAGIAKGSGTPNKEKVGKVTEKQVEEIAKQKMPDLNAASLETADQEHQGHGAIDGDRSGRWLERSKILAASMLQSRRTPRLDRDSRPAVGTRSGSGRAVGDKECK